MMLLEKNKLFSIILFFIFSILLILIIPYFEYDDVTTRLDRYRDSYLNFFFTDNELNPVLPRCIATQPLNTNIFQLYPSCYNIADISFRIKNYLLNSLTFITLLYFFIKLKLLTVSKKLYLTIFLSPIFIIFASSLIHESQMTILLLLFIGFGKIIVSIIVSFLILTFGDYHFLFPILIFAIIYASYSKSIGFGLIISTLLLITLNETVIQTLFKWAIKSENYIFFSEPLRKFIEVYSSNNNFGINNYPITRFLYSILEIFGNLFTSIVISVFIMNIIIIFYIFKKREKIFFEKEIYIFISYILVWTSILYNYTDVRFFPFLIIIYLKIISNVLSTNQIIKTMFLTNFCMVFEIFFIRTIY